ncbi:DUF6624 domain-containing protein [Massilia sp. CCM 8734]|uniref:DUF6624 domain-containing protein n=1 Tax=Massilia sp. CCM 8734 TaxID=2609283 RepID=UPI0014236E7E|nr:DUF6624 domain-containing protein [Massilia sp. CCM 8734]NHZ95398.1 hypothetical protein [Massilia sp. CCM 8734]
MRQWMFAIGTMLATSAVCAGEATGQAGPAPVAQQQQQQQGTHPHIAAELLAMVERDQEVRRRQDAARDSESIRAEMIALDAQHEPKIKAILADIGWPGVKAVGAQGNQAMWLLVQHASPALLKQTLPAMKKAAQDDELPWSTVALSIDRDLLNDYKKQLYGSQLFINKAGKPELSPVEDESRLDERRASIGLEPIAAYLRRFEAP